MTMAVDPNVCSVNCNTYCFIYSLSCIFWQFPCFQRNEQIQILMSTIKIYLGKIQPDQSKVISLFIAACCFCITLNKKVEINERHLSHYLFKGKLLKNCAKLFLVQCPKCPPLSAAIHCTIPQVFCPLGSSQQCHQPCVQRHGVNRSTHVGVLLPHLMEAEECWICIQYLLH